MEHQAIETPPLQESPSELPIRSGKRKLVIILLIIVVILLIAAGVSAYLWRDAEANTQHADDTAKINDLTSTVDQLKKDAVGAKNTTLTPKAEIKNPVSAITRSNLADAIKSSNTAALEGFMAPSVHVIIAASEGVGDRTPTQVMSDLHYISGAVSPWNFNLDQTTLAKYAAGSYKSYFLTDSLVGKSSDGYVISFNFDASGNISGIFMAIKEDLLF